MVTNILSALSMVCTKCLAVLDGKLGCLFLFSGIHYWGSKTKQKRIPEDFFFSCVFRGNCSQVRFLDAITGIFRKNSCGTGILVFSPDSSKFLRIRPDSCSPRKLPGLGQLTKSPPTSSPTSKLTTLQTVGPWPADEVFSNKLSHQQPHHTANCLAQAS